MKPRHPVAGLPAPAAPGNAAQRKAGPIVPAPYSPFAAVPPAMQAKRSAVAPPPHVPGQAATRGATPPKASASLPLRPAPMQAAAIQPLSKRWKNVLTLGGRKAYVEIKRAVRAHQAAAAAAAPPPVVQAPPPAVQAPPPVDPRRTNTPQLRPIRDAYREDYGGFTLEELQEHMTAYEHARYFQATKDKSIASIMRTGLDRRFGGSGEGASATADPNSRAGNAGKVYLGGDRKTALYYEAKLRLDQTATPETLRVFLTPAAARTMAEDFADSDNEAYWTSEVDVPPGQLLRGRIKNASRQELIGIFTVVREWYPDPQAVTVDDVIARHMASIGRIDRACVQAWQGGPRTIRARCRQRSTP